MCQLYHYLPGKEETKNCPNVLLLSKWIGLKLGGDMRDLIPGIQVEEKYQRTAGKLVSFTSAAHTSKLNLEKADALALGLPLYN